MGESIEVLAQRIKALERRTKGIEEACCSKSTIKREANIDLLIKQMQEFTETAKIEINLLHKRADKFDRIVYISIGIFIAIQFFGLDDKIRAVVGG